MPQILSLVAFLVHGAVLLAAVPQYEYATGDRLNLALEAQSFAGISDLVTLGLTASPLDLSTVKIGTATSPVKNYRMSSIQSSGDYQSAFSVSADAQGGYGAFTGSASAKYMQSKTLTSKSSMYFMNFEKQVGTVFLNGEANLTESALRLLTENPEQFVAIYGRYYVHGLTLGCQATATVTTTAKTELDKKSLDVKAKASYTTMISASAEFTSHMQSQTGLDHMDTEVFIYGGDVPAGLNDLTRIQTEIVDAMDTGGKCVAANARVTRAVVRGWLSLPAIAEAAGKHPDIVQAITPKTTIDSDVLNRLNSVKMKTRNMLDKADKCHRNVFSCVTKQWNEPVDTRRDSYQGAFTELTKFRDGVDQTNEASLSNSSLVLSYETELEAAYQKWVKPAEALTSFTFTFDLRVLNWYDDYQDPPPHGTYSVSGSFTIDPNHEDTDSGIAWTQTPILDNGHANCRHFYGDFYAKYQSNSQSSGLSVRQWWNRVCGSAGYTDYIVFHPGGDTSGSQRFDSTVQTKWSFTVKYGKVVDANHEAVGTLLV